MRSVAKTLDAEDKVASSEPLTGLKGICSASHYLAV